MDRQEKRDIMKFRGITFDEEEEEDEEEGESDIEENGSMDTDTSL